MQPATRHKISFLQAYIKAHSTRWYKRYGENVSGVRIDWKNSQGKRKPYYSIVFHVVRKIPQEHLPPKQLIPPFFTIRFPDGKERRVKTDVHETGRFQFHAHLLDAVTEIETGETGALGLFLTNNRQQVFALTNFHVAAKSLLYKDVYFFDATQSGSSHSVRVNGQLGYLYKGALTDSVDAAYIRLPDGLLVNNQLPGGLQISRTPVDGVIDPSYRGKILKFYIPSNDGSFTKTIIDNFTSVRTEFKKIDGVIAVDICTVPGDSGSAVLYNSNQVIGIVVGGDTTFTYIIPYYRIKSLLPLTII